MNIHDSDIVIRYVRTKNKTRKLTTYRSDECDLRRKHQIVQKFIEDCFIPSMFTKGYVRKRSIYHNAYAHLYNDYFIMMDIRDFFPHICHKQLADKLFFELNRIEPGQINRGECVEIVDLCSVGSRGLPLGFITSPILSNIYMKEFDGIFYGKLRKLGLKDVIYTRYADDLTVSFKYAGRDKLEQVKTEVTALAGELLSGYGLQLNYKKTRSYNLNVSNHVRVTGVNISKWEDGRRRLSVGRSIKNELYQGALRCLQTRDAEEISRIKGLQSFVLSIEKTDYESCYSEGMMAKVRELGFETLKGLIDSL